MNGRLGKLGFTMLVLLVGQYVLGMYTNLFVQIPDGVDGWKWMSNSLVIMGHVTLGTGLLVASVAMLVITGIPAVARRGRRARLPADHREEVTIRG